MARSKNPTWYDQKRGHYRTRFYELAEPGKRPPEYKLAEVEEIVYKTLQNGKRKKRSNTEKLNTLSMYRNSLLESLQSKEKGSTYISGIKTVFDQWLTSVDLTLTPGTYKNYRNMVRKYLSYFGNHPLTEVGTISRQFLGKMAEDKLAVTTKHQNMVHLKIFLRWANRHGQLKETIYLDLPKFTEEDPQTFTEEELEDILTYVENKIKTDKRYKDSYVTILRSINMLRFTAMRSSEVFTLLLERIDLENRLIYIKDNPEKGFTVKARKNQEVGIPKRFYPWLKADLEARGSKERYYLDNGSGDTHWTMRQGMYAFMKDVQRSVGIDRGIDPIHGFRATAITKVVMKHGLVYGQKFARHSDVKQTMKYVNRRLFDMQKVLDDL